MTGKGTIRAEMRAARAAHRGGAIPAPEQFRGLLRHGLTVASYVPMDGEANPTALARAAVEAGCAIVLPHVIDRATPLRFLAWDTEAALVAGPFGLSQPAADAEPRAPDIILAPLVAFDAALNRVGQGAGHYDRAFGEFPHARRIGVAWSFQQVARIDPDPWDLPLHAVVTENGWIVR